MIQLRSPGKQTLRAASTPRHRAAPLQWPQSDQSAAAAVTIVGRSRGTKAQPLSCSGLSASAGLAGPEGFEPLRFEA